MDTFTKVTYTKLLSGTIILEDDIDVLKKLCGDPNAVKITYLCRYKSEDGDCPYTDRPCGFECHSTTKFEDRANLSELGIETVFEVLDALEDKNGTPNISLFEKIRDHSVQQESLILLSRKYIEVIKCRL